jgi:hypothetical protein
MNIETGRMPSAADTAKEGLAPVLPAGMDSAQEIPADPPILGDLGAEFTWE